MLSIVLFVLLAFIQIALSGDECISGQSLTGSDEIKCDDDFACEECDSIVLSDGKLLNCGGDSSCMVPQLPLITSIMLKFIVLNVCLAQKWKSI